MMEEAMTLNNNAVLYLQIGNTFEACNLLTQASAIYLQLSDFGAGNKHRKKHREHRITWIDFAISDDEFPLDNMDRVNFPLVYKYALTVNKACCCGTSPETIKCCCCGDDSDTCPCILSPVIWYNLGLTCQILGANLDDNTGDKEFYFRRSFDLYQRVLSTCANAGDAHGLSTLIMAALNNIACVLYSLGKYGKCWEMIRRLQFMVQSCSSQPGRHPEYTIFYSNMMLLDFKAPMTASAA